MQAGNTANKEAEMAGNGYSTEQVAEALRAIFTVHVRGDDEFMYAYRRDMAGGLPLRGLLVQVRRLRRDFEPVVIEPDMTWAGVRGADLIAYVRARGQEVPAEAL